MSCYKCENRKIGCHSSCASYQEEKRRRDERNALIWTKKQRMADAEDYFFSRKFRT